MSDEAIVRFGVFLTVIAIMAVWEICAPLRQMPAARHQRWHVNFALVVLSAVLARVTVGAVLITAALSAAEQGMGLVHWVGAEGVWALVLSVILLDMAIYGQHVATHKIPLLWRLHQVHHSDQGFDVSTAVRFHPVEIVLSLIYKSAVVLLVGPDPWMIVAYEAALSGFALFNHGNVSLPSRLEKGMRIIFVTPDMHRIHHSVWQPETDSNYGNILSVWDRLFGTYLAEPEGGQRGMRLGLDQKPAADAKSLLDVLVLPFKNNVVR